MTQMDVRRRSSLLTHPNLSVLNSRQGTVGVQGVFAFVSVVMIIGCIAIISGLAGGWYTANESTLLLLASLGLTLISIWNFSYSKNWILAGVIPPMIVYLFALHGSFQSPLSLPLLFFYPFAILLAGATMGKNGSWCLAGLSILSHFLARGALNHWLFPEFMPESLTFGLALLGITLVQTILLNQNDQTGLRWNLANRLNPTVIAEREVFEQSLLAISENQKILHALHQKEKLLQSVVSNAPIVLWSIDRDGIFTLSEGTMLAKLGLSPGQIVGISLFDFYKDYPQIIENTRRALAGKAVIVEMEIDGFVFDARYNPVIDEKGQVTGVIGVSIDITDRKLTERQLEQQFRRFAGLHKIDNAIINNLEIQPTLTVLLEEVIEQLKIDAAVILLFEPENQTLRLAASQGFLYPSESDIPDHGKPGMRLGEGYAGLSALFRQKIYIPDMPDHQSEWLQHRPCWIKEGFASYIALPLITKNQIKGVLELFTRTPIRPNPQWLNYLTILSGQVAIAIDNATLFEDLQQSNEHLSLAYDLTLEGWARALELRDKETEGHSQRVLLLTTELAERMGVDEGNMDHIRRGALLHDIGKMGIPDSILLKPSPLTEDEWKTMRMHPIYAYQLLSPVPFLHPAIDIPYCHHERWDGTGYPRGLKGEEIPLSARIFSVVDAWDALNEDRPYRKAWPQERIITYLRDQSGKCFDPAVVKLFLSTIDS